MKESRTDSQPLPSCRSNIWARRICKNLELRSSSKGEVSSLKLLLSRPAKRGEKGVLQMAPYSRKNYPREVTFRFTG